MNKLLNCMVLASLILFSCTKDEASLVADFTATITGDAPNAQIVITNNSKEATSFLWTFGEGANIATSSEQNPGNVTVDKTGDFSVKLTVKNGAKESELTKVIAVSGYNGIKTFSDVEFAQRPDDVNLGRFFSTSEGKMYKTAEVNSTTGPLVDLVYQGDNSTFIFFESPDELFNSAFVIPGAKKTKVKNYESGFSVDVFDSMIDDRDLRDVIIDHDKNTIGTLKFPLIVMFENSAGRKGLIKLKAINSDRLLVDIKVQKY